MPAPPKILPRRTLGPRGDPDPKFRTRNLAKNENGILESARQGGSEKSSFAMYLGGKQLTIFNAHKTFSAPELITTKNGPVD